MSTTTERIPTTEMVYTTTEVLSLVPGLSYRVLDYFLRTGAITLTSSEEMPGSGRPRLFTPQELRALRRMFKRYLAAKEELAAIRDGRVWAEEIAA